MTLLFLLACTTADGANDADSGGLADTGEDTDTGGDTAPPCATVNSGDDWAWMDQCPRMTTPVVIEVNGCEMALDYDAVGGMTMGMPYAGTIDGDTVTFSDGDTVTGCVGTVETADKISGSCDGGCTYELRR
jgi:hypothetical protein